MEIRFPYNKIHQEPVLITLVPVENIHLYLEDFKWRQWISFGHW